MVFMRNTNRIICLISVLMLLPVLFLACGKSADEQLDKAFQYASFRDIPGVTEEEIKAIETLQKQVDIFIYGMGVSIESFEDENGEVRGYSALLCEWLTELFGITFKPKLYEWIDLVAGLETGEISFSGYLAITEERLKIYHMANPIALRPIKSYRLAGSRLPAEIVKERPLRCGFIEGGAVIAPVTSTMEDGTFEVVLLSDLSLVYDALINGEIDAFYFSSAAELYFINYGDIIATEFLPLSFMHASMSARNPAFWPVISIVQKALDSGALKYLVELYNRGYQDYLKYKLFVQLTEEERNFIREHTVIPFAAEAGNYPVSFYNPRDEQWQGIAFEILHEVQTLTGLSFERVNDKNASLPVLLKMLEDGEVSMITELIYSPERSEDFCWPNATNMVSYPALMSNSSYHNIVLNEILFANVGFISDYGHMYLFREWFPNHSGTAKEYDSSLAAFNALDSGEVDMVFTSSHQLLLMTNFNERTGYKINYLFNSPLNSTFGFNKDNAVLCSIVDKALPLINTSIISDQWLRKTYEYRSKVLEDQRPWLMSALVLFMFALILIAVLFVKNLSSGKKLKEVVGEQSHDLKLQTSVLDTFLDSIPDLFFGKDLDMRFTHFNKALLEHYGLSGREEVIGKREADIRIILEKAQEYDELCLKVINENQPLVLEEQIPHIDGKNLVYETIRLPLVIEGETTGVLGIARDITKRKEMEEAALAASRSKSAFLAHMSHEIRTPMNSIVGFSELALDDEIPVKTKDYLGKILENAEGLLQIINDVLDISKVESGKMELENIPFDMHELFASCRTLITPKAEEKGITLSFYAEPSIGKRPLGDPTRLRQVLFNLLSNAVKFTNSGIVKLIAKIIEKNERTIKMHFEVKDSGIGMTSEQTKKIFDPFVQGETGTTRKYGGTGLGLTITKNIIELMGGTLLVESTPGVGSKFSFEITFDTIDIADDKMSRQKLVFNELKKPTFEGEVLLCEDNVMNQQVICEHLARVGLKTVVAENGKIGVEMVKDRKEKGEKQFDLIFMDMHMPVMDGLEASARILELKTGVPIVAMTANIMSSDWEIYKESGMSDCVGKPFTSQELWRCLMKYLTPLNMDDANVSAQESGLIEADGKFENDSYLENDLKFQNNLQLMFAKSNQNKYEEIVKALGEGDIKLAYRLAHTLKSNAGQIDKFSLQKAAAEIEDQLKDGKNEVAQKQLALLKEELNAALEQIAAQTVSQQNVSQTRDTSPLDSQSAIELLEKLEPMLIAGNSECLDLIDSMYRIPGSEKMIELIEDFDFEQAEAVLAELREGLKQN